MQETKRERRRYVLALAFLVLAVILYAARLYISPLRDPLVGFLLWPWFYVFIVSAPIAGILALAFFVLGVDQTVRRKREHSRGAPSQDVSAISQQQPSDSGGGVIIDANHAPDGERKKERRRYKLAILFLVLSVISYVVSAYLWSLSSRGGAYDIAGGLWNLLVLPLALFALGIACILGVLALIFFAFGIVSTIRRKRGSNRLASS